MEAAGRIAFGSKVAVGPFGKGVPVVRGFNPGVPPSEKGRKGVRVGVAFAGAVTRNRLEGVAAGIKAVAFPVGAVQPVKNIMSKPVRSIRLIPSQRLVGGFAWKTCANPDGSWRGGCCGYIGSNGDLRCRIDRRFHRSIGGRDDHRCITGCKGWYNDNGHGRSGDNHDRTRHVEQLPGVQGCGGAQTIGLLKRGYRNAVNLAETVERITGPDNINDPIVRGATWHLCMDGDGGIAKHRKS